MSDVINKGGGRAYGGYDTRARERERVVRLERRVKALEAALKSALEDAESAMNVANRYGGGEFDIDACLADARAALRREE